MKKKIMIVEDDVDISSMIEYNLNAEGYESCKVDNGLHALQMVKKFKPDLIILDIMLPGMNGFEVCKKLKADEDMAHVSIIILTVKNSETDIVLGLELGADDYVTKPFSPRILLARIRNVLRRESDSQKNLSVLNYKDLSINFERREMRYKDKYIQMSKTEFEILSLLASKPGKVFSRNLILERCWPDGVFVVDRSVDVHINSIRKKIGDLGDEIESIRGIGYRLKDDE